MAAGNQQKHQFLMREFIRVELIKIKVIFILRQGMLPAKCRVTQKPGNSSVFCRKTKNPFVPKICITERLLGAVIPHESRNSEESIVS